jgi:multiple sugar transport system substrate-binding protein
MTNPYGVRGAPLSRRQVLAWMGGAGAVLALPACDVQTSADDPAGVATGAPQIEIPEPKVSIPTENVTFRWVDSGDLKALYQRPVFAAYSKKHPNIKTQYDGTGWDQVNQVVPLGIRNGSAPDVFALPQNVPAATAIAEGWVRPIDDLIPDFDQWKAKFPPNTLVPGVHIFNDRVYSWPLSSLRRLNFMLFYDTEYLQAAGYDDPGTQLGSWDELRQAARKITEQGKGKYFGLMLGAPQLRGIVSALANTAGWRGIEGDSPDAGGFDLLTGRYNYADPIILEAIDLLRAMQSDKSLFPGFLGLKDVDARGRMPNRVAGMIFDGPWDIPAWPKANPDWKFDLIKLPPQEKGAAYTVPFQERGANASWVYAKTKYPQIAADLYSYMGSVDGQTQLVILSQGNLVSMIPEANEKAQIPQLLDPHARKATELAKSLMRNAPVPAIRNADAAAVALELKVVKPNFNDIMEGVFSGQIGDAKAELTKLNDSLNANLDRAIAAAKTKGAEVTREDWTFSNWKPAQEYTKADYDAL